MIAVVMRDQQRFDDVMADTGGRESRENLLPAESGVYKQGAVGRVNQHRVPTTAASQHCDANFSSFVVVFQNMEVPNLVDSSFRID
jgi:hypothetical protein